MPEDHRWTADTGATLGWRWTPVSAAGLYVPGGLASYPSSVLMNAIPAKVAGVGEVVMVVPAPDGQLNPVVLGAAHLAGIDRVITIGGAQAVAALAYGTQTIPAVDKIVGPGNAYVAAAKRRVFGRVGIDSIAGPSEIVIISDGGTDPRWLAMDLFSQAEHDELAQSILISPDSACLDAVEAAMNQRLAELDRQDIVRASVGHRGALILARDFDDAAAISNHIAPEHLELAVDAPRALMGKIRHAGAIFLGRHTPEAFGDYCAGPNHVLPTYGYARSYSGLSLDQFMRGMTVQELTRDGLAGLAEAVVTLAGLEGLDAHASAVTRRLRAES